MNSEPVAVKVLRSFSDEIKEELLPDLRHVFTVIEFKRLKMVLSIEDVSEYKISIKEDFNSIKSRLGKIAKDVSVVCQVPELKTIDERISVSMNKISDIELPNPSYRGMIPILDCNFFEIYKSIRVACRQLIVLINQVIQFLTTDS
jgi:hypothetical protein